MQVRSLAELVSLAERVGVLGGTSGSPELLMEPLNFPRSDARYAE